MTPNQLIIVSTLNQEMLVYKNDRLMFTYQISSGKNGVGEQMNSECTPRGWHKVYSIIGMELPINSVLVGRQWTGEIYTEQLAKDNPGRDWILTRIIQIDGLEEGRNKGGEVDSLARYIYFHGTPDSTKLGIPGSRGCIRMNNNEIIELASWITPETFVYIE